MTLTPMMFTTVVNTISARASTMAFCAPAGVLVRPASEEPPTISKPSETCGRITWYATATAAAVTIEPMMMIQPAIQDVAGLATCFAHWYTEPANGNCPASSAKQSATAPWPTKTIGQVQIIAGPPEAKPKPKSWKTPVMMEM